MLHVWSQCLLILLFICFFIGSTARIPTNSLSSIDNEAASNNKKVRMAASASTNERSKPKEEMLRMMINKAILLNQESLIAQEKPGNIVNKCDHASKFSSKSIPSSEKAVKLNSSIKRVQRVGRKLLPRERDMDAFVAYADYRGPQRHPPKNN